MSLTPSKRTEILTRIKKHVLKHHFNVAGVSYEAWTRRVDERAPKLLTADIDEFEAGIRQLLLELGSSHTVLYHERENRVLPQHSINATLRAFKQTDGERWIFLDVFDDGPAHIAGVKPGDTLLAVDGTASTPPSIPRFMIGHTHRLSVSNIRGEKNREIVVEVPKKKAVKQRLPIIEPKSLVHTMIAPNIGLLKVTYFSGAMGMRFANELDAAIRDLREQGCDHLIIDLRGNIGGSLGFARLASYMCPGQIPIGNSLTPKRLRLGWDKASLPPVPMPRTKGELFLTLTGFMFRDKSVVLLTQGLGPQPFHGKIVVLVNEWTNSAAEMVASFGAENRLATVVGNNTAGNVLGAANFSVGSGYWARLPIFGWYTSLGISLEGKGVSPDVVVDVDPNLLNAGIDQHVDKAVEILTGITAAKGTRA